MNEKWHILFVQYRKIKRIIMPQNIILLIEPYEENGIVHSKLGSFI